MFFTRRGCRRSNVCFCGARPAAALLAIDVLSSQQVLPGLQREGFRLRAAWLPRPTPATAQKLTELSRALPPLCRAATDDPAAAPRPRALLDDFLAAVVD